MCCDPAIGKGKFRAGTWLPDVPIDSRAVNEGHSMRVTRHRGAADGKNCASNFLPQTEMNS